MKTGGEGGRMIILFNTDNDGMEKNSMKRDVTWIIRHKNTHHHHEWRNPGGSPNVMFFSHRIWTEGEREWEKHIKYKNMPDIWIICFTRLEKGAREFL